MKWLVPLLFLPCTVFATITVNDRQTGNNTSAGLTLTITYTGTTMTAGNTGILVLAMDNANGATGNITLNSSWNDSKGNAWVVRSQGIGAAANAVAEGAILVSQLTANFVSGDTLVLTFNASTTSKAWSFIEAAPSAGSVVMFTSTLWSTSSSTAAPTITGNFASTGDLYVGAAAAENNGTWTGDGDSTLGSWTTLVGAVADPGTGATNAIAVGSQTKVVTGYGQQIFNPTPGATIDCRVGWAIFVETDPKARTVYSNQGTSTTITIPVNTALTAGSLGVLCLAADNAGSAGSATNVPSSFTDTQGNTWTRQQQGVYDNGVANAGAEFGLYTATITTGLGLADTISNGTPMSVTVPNKAAVVWEFAPAVGGNAVTYVSGSNTAGASATSFNATTSSITNGDYVVAMIAMEGGTSGNFITADSDTTNGAWSTQGQSGAGTADQSSMHICAQWKKVTATATQSYDVSVAATADGILGWVSINDASPTGLSAAQKAGFFMLFP